MIDKLVNDINKALTSEAYFSALALTLSLPDVCGKAEYPNLKVGERYKKWYDDYLGQYETYEGSENPYLSGEVVYSLRNSFLHQVTPNIDKNKIFEHRNKKDNFILIIQPKNEFDIYCDSSSLDSSGEKTYYVNIQRLCFIITHGALAYYNKNKDKFNFLKYTVQFQY